MKIQVTQEHIDKGHCGEATSCPIALALSDLNFRGVYWSIFTEDKLFTYRKNDVTVDIELPAEAKEFVKRYDGEESVEPFEFELLLPDEAHTLFEDEGLAAG